MSLACAVGIRQPKLDAYACALLREISPWAFILFREACVSREQVRVLCDQLRDGVGHDAIIWIDQEGGRVARLKAPEWPTFPAAARYGEIYGASHERGLEAVKLGHRLMAHELKAMGVDGDYAPVLDLKIDGADDIVGDRAFSRVPETIAALGRAALEGLADGGVVGCVKHLPGHGRAEADSHLELPRVSASAHELAADIAPFKALNDAPAAMTAHIIYEAWDKDRPATCSPSVIGNIIRGEIAFQGLLMSDDLDMKALQFAINGDLADRARAALKAGCDVVLQCSGRMSDMEDVAHGCARLEGVSLVRARAAEAFAKRPARDFDAEAGWVRFKQLLAS